MPRSIVSADPKAAYLAAKDAIDAAIRRVLDSGRYILGPEVEAFEREFAAYLGTAGRDAGAREETRGIVVGVANGTDALELALRALGLGPGDRVATVANSVSATAAAIVATGATPVFVEIDDATLLMDPGALEAAFVSSPGIKAVVPVHLYGQPCDLPSIVAIARRHGAVVVEDCAQAHGAACGGRLVGTWGDLAAFSFYPTKNLGALGDGGAVAGSNRPALEQVARLRQYGWRTRYVSEGPGRNSRLDELQAAILRAQLPGLDAANAHRARLAGLYSQLLAPASTRALLRLPTVAPGRTAVWHQYVVRSPRRDELRAHLESQGIHCGVLYPVPLHRQPGFAGLHASEAGLPRTEQACAEVLSLPLHPGITEADVRRVAESVLQKVEASG